MKVSILARVGSILQLLLLLRVMFRVYVYWSSSDKYQVFRIRFSHICKSSLYMHFGRYDCTLKTSVSCTPPHDIASDFSNCHPVFQLCLVDRQRQRQSRTEVQWRVHWPESLQRRRGLSHLHWWVSSASSRAQPLTLVSLFSVVEGSVIYCGESLQRRWGLSITLVSLFSVVEGSVIYFHSLHWYSLYIR